MGFPKQKYWSESPFPSPGDLPDPRIELASTRPPSALAGQFLTTSTTEEASTDITQEQLDGRDTKGMGEGCSFQTLYGHHSPRTSTCSPAWKLSKAHPFGVLLTLPWLNHWPLVTELNLEARYPPRTGRGTESSNLLIMELVLRETSPHVT